MMKNIDVPIQEDPEEEEDRSSRRRSSVSVSEEADADKKGEMLGFKSYESQGLPDLHFQHMGFEWIDEAGKTVVTPIYVTQQSTDCTFQYSYWQNCHRMTLRQNGQLPFLLGHIKLPREYPIQQPSLTKIAEELYFLKDDHDTFSREEIALVNELTSKREAFIWNTGTLSNHLESAKDSLHFSPVTFLPNIEGMLELDIKELEHYYYSKQAIRSQYYSRAAVTHHKASLKSSTPSEREKTIELFLSWLDNGSKIYCHASTCAKAKFLMEHVEGAEEFIIKNFVEVAKNSGLFDETNVMKKDNYSKLLLTFSILLDSSEKIRLVVAQKLTSFLEILNSKDFDLFQFERKFVEDPTMIDSLILYIMAETDRLDKAYHKAKIFLEFVVTRSGEETTLGLLLGDMIELQSSEASDPDTLDKMLSYYIKSYKVENAHISMISLSRLTTLHHRVLLTNQTLDETQKKDLYKDILESHLVMATVFNNPSMEFLLYHYFTGRCYVTGELAPKEACQRPIENLALSRRCALKESLTYFDYFYVMGRREDFLLQYFEVLHLLKYVECSMAALRYAIIDQKAIGGYKKFLPYAMCKMEGIGTNLDFVYACQVFQGNLLENCQEFSIESNLQSAKYIYLIANILSRFHDFELEEKTDFDVKKKTTELYMYSLLYILHATFTKNPSKQVVYYFLKLIIELRDKFDIEVQIQKKIVSIVYDSFHLAANDVDDLLYQYRIEEEIATKVYQYDSIKAKNDVSLNSLINTSTAANRSPSPKFDPNLLTLTSQKVGLLVGNLSSKSGLSPVSKESDPPSASKGEYPQVFNDEDHIKTLKKFHFFDVVNAIKTKTSRQEKAVNMIHSLTIELIAFLSKKGITLSRTFVKSNILTSVEECIRNIIVFSKSDSSKLKSGITSPERKPKSKMLFVLSVKEKEITSSLRTKSTNAKFFSDTIKLTDLRNTFVSELAKHPLVKVFDQKEYTIYESESDQFYFLGKKELCTINKAVFTKNNQTCRCFTIYLKSIEAVTNFFSSILYFETCSPFFLNYFGLSYGSSTGNLEVRLFSENFKCSMTNQDGTSLFSSPEIPTKTKLSLFHDLLLAVQSMHFMGIGHLFLTPSHMFVTEDYQRLKLMIPFFMPYFKDHAMFYPEIHQNQNLIGGITGLDLAKMIEQATSSFVSLQLPLADMVCLSPNLCNYPVFPKKDPIIFSSRDETISSSSQIYPLCDIWSIGVIFVQLLNNSSFGEAAGVKSREEYLQSLVKKSLVEGIIEKEIKKLKKMNLKERPPLKEMTKMLSSKSSDRYSIYEVIDIVEAFLIREGFTVDELVEKRTDKFYMREMFACTTIQRMLPSQKDEDKAEKSIWMAANVEYCGTLNSKGFPDGFGRIRKDKKILVEGDFKNGILGHRFSLITNFGDVMSYDINSIDHTLNKCELIPPGPNRPKIDLTKKINPYFYFLPITSQIYQLFSNFQSRKTYAQTMKDENLRSTRTAREKVQTTLKSVTTSLISRIKEMKTTTRKYHAHRIPISRLKRLQDEDEDSVSSDETISEEDEEKVRKGKENKLSSMEFSVILEFVENYTQIITDYPLKFKQHTIAAQDTELRYTSANSTSTISAFYDPFGHKYMLPYSKDIGRPRYSKGMLITSTRYDSLACSHIFIPCVSSFLLFESRLVTYLLTDCTQAMQTFPVLLKQLMSYKTADQKIIVTQSEVMFRGKTDKEMFTKGDVFFANKALRVNACRGDVMIGKMIIEKKLSGLPYQLPANQAAQARALVTNSLQANNTLKDTDNIVKDNDHFLLRYEGEVRKGKFDGIGTLKIVLGPNGAEIKIYTGEFKEDLPHGFGTMFDKSGAISQDSFTGYFYQGVKYCGFIATKTDVIEGIFKSSVENETSQPMIAKIPTLEEILRINAKSFQVVGSVTNHYGSLKKYGIFPDSIQDYTGFYQIYYKDGAYYKGNFKNNNRDGNFVMCTKEGDIVAGKWEYFKVTGVVYWNPSNKKILSQGTFVLKETGELSQEKLGKIFYRNEDVYTGDIINNKPSGYGKLESKNKSYYEGQFLSGAYNGYGELFNSDDGTIYQGDFKSSMKNGYGILQDKDGTAFKGYFNDDVCELMIMENPKLSIYNCPVTLLVSQVGQDWLVNHEPRGYCQAFMQPSMELQSRYSKEIKEIEFHGQIKSNSIQDAGAIFVDNETVYEGNFSNGQLHEYGKLQLGVMKYYMGQFDKNKISGFGYIKDYNMIHKGEFLDQKKNGLVLSTLRREHWRLGKYVNDVKTGEFLEKNIPGYDSEGHEMNLPHPSPYTLRIYDEKGNIIFTKNTTKQVAF
jgi:hypothetical protein